MPSNTCRKKNVIANWNIKCGFSLPADKLIQVIRLGKKMKAHSFMSIMRSYSWKGGRNFSISDEQSTNPLKLKDLERVGSRAKYIYNRPARDDIESHPDTSNFLQKVSFEGPPPFELPEKQLKMIQSHRLWSHWIVFNCFQSGFQLCS